MTESASHVGLVNELLSWVRSNVPNWANGFLTVDRPAASAQERPPSIGGFYPDLYFGNLQNNKTIVGEAKTVADLESRRSCLQITAFLLHLKSCVGGVLVIAVPWYSVPRARSLLKIWQRDSGTTDVQVVFIEKLSG